MPATGPNLGPTMGATYLGSMGAGILYGSTNIQTFLYFKNYPDDPQFQRYAVAVLWVLDSLHMALTIIEIWQYLIDSFGDYTDLLHVTWSYKLQITISIILIMSIQSLYAVRLWKLSLNFTRIWAWVLTLILFAGYASVTTFIVRMYGVSSFVQLGTQLRWEILLSFAMSTTTFAGTKSRIWIIMCYAIISGMLTSLCSLTSLITCAIMPHNLIFQSIEFLLPKLHINSYLAMLNARKSARDHSIPNPSANMMRPGDLESRHLTSHDPHPKSVRSVFESSSSRGRTIKHEEDANRDQNNYASASLSEKSQFEEKDSASLKKDEGGSAL